MRCRGDLPTATCLQPSDGCWSGCSASTSTGSPLPSPAPPGRPRPDRICRRPPSPGPARTSGAPATTTRSGRPRSCWSTTTSRTAPTTSTPYGVTCAGTGAPTSSPPTTPATTERRRARVPARHHPSGPGVLRGICGSATALERQPGVYLLGLPGASDPRVLGVVDDEPLPLLTRAGHHVEVVHVVAGRGHRGAVPTVRHEDDVAGPHLGHHVDRPAAGAVDPLVAERPGARRHRRVGAAHLEVVDLLQLALAVLVLLVVLVRRVGGPVPGRCQHLAGDDRVGVEHVRRTEVADLAGGVSGAAELAHPLLGRDAAKRQLRLGLGMRHGQAGTRRADDGEAGHARHVGKVGRAGERVTAPLEEEHLFASRRLPPAPAGERPQEPLAVPGPDLAALAGREGEDVQARVFPARFPRAERDVETVPRG